MNRLGLLQKETLEPQWNEAFVFTFERSDYIPHYLVFDVNDWDLVHNDAIGTVVIATEEIALNPVRHTRRIMLSPSECR
jgi:Ca2+-dependent lipid-binding protein